MQFLLTMIGRLILLLMTADWNMGSGLEDLKMDGML